MCAKFLFNCNFAGQSTKIDPLLNETIFVSLNAISMEAVARCLISMGQHVDMITPRHIETSNSTLLTPIKALTEGLADIEFRAMALNQERHSQVDFGLATRVRSMGNNNRSHIDDLLIVIFR